MRIKFLGKSSPRLNRNQSEDPEDAHMILDVGCGPCKRGDIGIDRIPYEGVDFVIDLEKSPLPFPDNTFDKVISHHFLEHMHNPEKVLVDMVRVSKRQIYIVVPHRWGKWAWSKSNTKHPYGHRCVFHRGWFVKFAHKYNLGFHVGYTYMPFLWCLQRPCELKVLLLKQEG